MSATSRRHFRRDRAHVDIDAAGLEAFDDAVGAERDVLHRLAVGDDREHHVGYFGDGLGRIRPAHPGIDQGLRLGLGPVPAGDLVSGGLQARHHAEAHHAKADKTNSHACSPAASIVLRFAVPRTRAVELRTIGLDRQHQMMRFRGLVLDDLDHDARRFEAGLVMLDPNRRQRRRQPVHQRHIVEAGDRNVAGAGDVVAPERRDRADREPVIGADHSGEGSPADQQFLGAALAFGFVEGLGERRRERAVPAIRQARDGGERPGSG